MKFILVAVFMSLTGCSGLLNKFMKEPKVDIERVDIRDATLTQAKLVFVLKVQNPNSFDIKIDEVSYKVLLNNEPFAVAKTDQVVVVKEKSDTLVELPLPVHYDKLWKNLQSLVMAKSLTYKIEGDAKLSSLSIPFKEEGKLELGL